MKIFKPICILLGLFMSINASPSNKVGEQTKVKSANYLGDDLKRNYSALITHYHSQAIFYDPTANVFSSVLLTGPIQGAANIIELQKKRSFIEKSFDIQFSMVVGEYALYRGNMTVRYGEDYKRYTFPYVTVHRIQNNKLTERLDFADYVSAFNLKQFHQNSSETESIAKQYLRAYLGGDIKTQSKLIAADIRVQDPTAQIFGPQSGKLFIGAEQLLKRRKQLSLNVSDFDFEVESSFFQNHHAVFMGVTKYTIGNRSWRQPAVFVFEVRDKKVTRQWDFVDYTVAPIN